MTSRARTRLGIAVLVALLLPVPAAGAARSARVPPPVWGLQPAPRAASQLTAADLVRLRAGGVNTLILPDNGRHRALRRAAARAQLRRLTPLSARGLRGRALRRACRRSPGRLCVVRVRSLTGARRTARRRGPDLVMARVGGPGLVARVRLPRRGRLLAVVPLRSRRPYESAAWKRAIVRARRQSRLDLAAYLPRGGPAGRAALDRYLELLRKAASREQMDPALRGPLPTPPTPPSPPPSVFVSPGGSDSGPCTRVAPCASFDRGYRVARPGELIELAAGVYPTQVVRADPSKTNASGYVFFEPAPGAVVEIDGDLRMLGSHAVFRGSRARSNFRLRTLYSDASSPVQRSSTDVIFEELDGAGFQIGPTSRIAIKGGDWGPITECGPQPSQQPKVTGLFSFPGRVPTNIVLDGLYIHDVNSLDLVRCHTGGMIVESADGFALRNTRFSQTAVYGIQMGDFSGEFGNPRHVVIENNWFGAPVEADGRTNDGQPELQLSESGVYDDWLIRHNSFHNGIAVTWDDDARHSSFRVIGNVGRRSDCRTAPGVVWAYNVWTTPACGPTDLVVRGLPYVDSAVGREDFHLRAGAAQDFVTATTPDHQLATDIDGDPRPRGPARDAGADER